MTQLKLAVVTKGKIDSLPPPSVSPRKKRSESRQCLLAATVVALSLVVVLSASLFVWLYAVPCVQRTWNNVRGYMNQVSGHKIQQEPQNVDTKAGEEYSFDDIFDSRFSPKGWPHRWVGDYLVYRDEDGHLIEAGLPGINRIMDNSFFTNLNTGTYYVSPNRDYVLLAYDIKKVWRHSFSAKYKVYQRYPSIPEDQLIDFPSIEELQGQHLQYARWSTNGEAVAFVYGNNLYYQGTPTAATEQITTNGVPDVIFNGIPDWVYEEDVLSTSVAHYWAPNSEHLLFAEFDDTHVPWMEWPTYGEPNDVYGDVTRLKYPKAGDVTADGQPGNNTQVKLFVKRVGKEDAPLRINPPAELANEYHYYTQAAWRDNSYVFITWTNRIQTRAVVTLCYIQDGSCVTNLDQTVNGGWHRAPWPIPRFIDNGESYLSLGQKDEGPDGRWQHVALMTSPTTGPGTETFLTSGTEEVSGIVGYDPTLSVVYYYSTNGDPKTRHLKRVGTPAADEQYRPAVCVSCAVEAYNCTYFSATISPNSGLYTVLSCLGPGIPQVFIRNLRTGRSTIVEDNQQFRDAIATKDLPERQFMQIPIGGGYQGWAEVWVPPGIPTDGSQKFPLLVYTYAGPESQRVNNFNPFYSMNVRWLQHLASQEKVVIASLDGRGSSRRGNNFLFEMYRRMGTVEVQDQIEAARYFTNNLPYVSRINVTIWGWSYGGHTASHALADPSNVYTCALAVAPVLSQHYYDTAYTERYMAMATPSDNQGGYNATSVMRKVANMVGKKYLIAHGTADDNVHFHNAAQMMMALNEAEIMYETLMYVDKAHSITGTVYRRHLYTAMKNFLLDECMTPV